MSRVARIVVPGIPYHITQRGNNRQDVFFVDDDRQQYLQLLIGQAQKHGLRLHAYCLMTNHIHLIATPERVTSLAKALGRAHFHYTLYVNRLHGRVGHLWQNRFYSCPLDDWALWAAMCYVERNPVRAGMVKRAWQYRWSSASAHCSTGPAATFLDDSAWRSLLQERDWKESLVQPQDNAITHRIRRSTFTGRPLGSDSFVSKLETLLGRRLRRQPMGRPRKVRGMAEHDAEPEK
ncbi:MAG: transposase [Phycisphaerae bacterium]